MWFFAEQCKAIISKNYFASTQKINCGHCTRRLLNAENGNSKRSQILLAAVKCDCILENEELFSLMHQVFGSVKRSSHREHSPTRSWKS
jgi:hypothetical protein